MSEKKMTLRNMGEPSLLFCYFLVQTGTMVCVPGYQKFFEINTEIAAVIDWRYLKVTGSFTIKTKSSLRPDCNCCPAKVFACCY
ncbi:MAG: hypothetical protein V4632_03975 [Pseudomonadota bacterium]